MSDTSRSATTATAMVHGGLMMPFSNVRDLPFAEQVEATRLAGFGQLSMHPHQARAEVERRGAQEMLDLAADSGVSITRLDPLSNWNPRWLPQNMDDQYIRDFDIDEADFFELCELLEVGTASLNATFADGVYSHDEIVEAFAATAAQGRQHGVVVDLENLPMWGVRTIADAWAIVEGSGDPEAGLVVDSLHYVRSSSTLDMLRAVPGERIHVVQLNDGPLVLPPEVTLEENCFDRDWPGDGEFPLLDILAVLVEKDALRQVNAEVFSPDNVGRSAQEIADLSSSSLRRLLDSAGISA